MPSTRSTAMAKAAPVKVSLTWRPKGFGPWPQRPQGLPSIVTYADEAAPSNDYPARIVSPRQAAACCARGMVNVGDPQQESGWLFQYRRCPRCGFTVRRILREVPDEAMLATLRLALAYTFVREARDAA